MRRGKAVTDGHQGDHLDNRVTGGKVGHQVK